MLTVLLCLIKLINTTFSLPGIRLSFQVVQIGLLSSFFFFHHLLTCIIINTVCKQKFIIILTSSENVLPLETRSSCVKIFWEEFWQFFFRSNYYPDSIWSILPEYILAPFLYSAIQFKWRVSGMEWTTGYQHIHNEVLKV